jgi:ferredoxin
MSNQRIVTRVWIETGCITCDACETVLPEVFEVQESSCTIRPEALDAEFLRVRSGAIADAALECPVDVIKFESAEIPTTDSGVARVTG